MSSNNHIVALLEDLISFESVTPDVSDCQKYIDKYLSKSNFKTEYKKFDDVQNMIYLWKWNAMFGIYRPHRCSTSRKY